MGICESKIEIKNKVKDELKNELKDEIKKEINNVSKNRAKIEVLTEQRIIPVKIITKVIKAICKIKIKPKKGRTKFATGFFMNYSKSLKCLMTNYHVINPNLEFEFIEIEIHNENKMLLKLNNRTAKFIERPKDLAMIEIKKSDEIYNDIEFLDYDYNYSINGYAIYKNLDVFSIEHPNGGEAKYSSGKIIDIDGYEFMHNISTDKGSSGCPIILLNDNINLIQVIGIHKEGYEAIKLNGGTFIGEIFNKENEKNYINYIISEIYIKTEDINKDIRIINSYEESERTHNAEIEDEYKNEEEIKKCEIKINDEIIPFNYFYNFKSKGKYRIIYSFKNYLNKTCYMFSFCSFLSNIDLSHFNTDNITDMSKMFLGCSSLTNINLSNCNAEKVIDMSFMFLGCSSLANIDLSNFKTKNVVNMMYMFSGCSSLTNIDLSHFITDNVITISYMFFKCSSLTYINLPDFNDVDLEFMFFGCLSLKKENIITKNKNILNEF